MFVMQGIVNAIYAMYGKDEPSPDTSTAKIAEELNEMAKERRQADLLKNEAQGRQD